MSIFDLLFKPNESRPLLVSKVLGCFFLLISGGMSTYFLFQALAPVVGYVEGGMIVSVLVGVLGVGLLCMGQKKPPSPPEEALEKALSFFKELEIEKYLKKNALAVSLLSFVGGVILSQLNKDIKSLSGIYKELK